MFDMYDIMKTYEAALQALVTPTKPRLEPIRRLVAMSESYHAIQPFLFPHLALEHIAIECQCEGKFCSSCQTVKCYLAFHKDKKGKHGLGYRCKSCVKTYQRDHAEQTQVRSKNYRQNNRERIRINQRLYQQTHREQQRKRNKDYRQRHSEQIRQTLRRWREYHYEYDQERKKVYRLRNIEKIREYGRLYYRKHAYQKRAYDMVRRKVMLEQFRQYERQRYQTPHRQRWTKQWIEDYKQHRPDRYKAIQKAHTHRYRASKRAAGGTFTALEWHDLVAFYRHQCLCCGKYEPEIKLTPDHVIPLSCGGDNMIANIQPLCQSCNSRKGAKIIDYRMHSQGAG